MDNNIEPETFAYSNIDENKSSNTNDNEYFSLEDFELDSNNEPQYSQPQTASQEYDIENSIRQFAMEYSKHTGTCLNCGGTGRTKENPYHCDKCGKDYIEDKVEKEHKIDLPASYFNKEYNKETFKEHIDLYIIDNNLKIQLYNILDKLDDIYINIKKGNMFMNTLHLSGDKVIKELYIIWIYSMIKQINLNRFTSSKILFLNDESLEDKDFLEKINTLDIVFLNITNYKLKETVEKLDHIIAKRKLLGKATVTISAIPANYLTSQIPYNSLDFDIDLSLVINPKYTNKNYIMAYS